jgi:hypothetical protein
MLDVVTLHACPTHKSVVADLRAVDDARHCLAYVLTRILSSRSDQEILAHLCADIPNLVL